MSEFEEKIIELLVSIDSKLDWIQQRTENTEINTIHNETIASNVIENGQTLNNILLELYNHDI